MGKFEPPQTPPKLGADEGWAVQIYSKNRRLLCVLEPSHGWVFLMGCGVGLLLSVIWINIARHSTPPVPTAPTKSPILQVD